MFVTLSGNVILFKLLHFSKASAPMVVTLFDIVILVIFSQELKAFLPIYNTPSGITTSFNLVLNSLI